MPYSKRVFYGRNKNLARVAIFTLCSLTLPPSYAQNGVELTAQVRECPSKTGDESAVLASAGLAIASSLVINLAAQAVDAVTNYLTIEQATTSEAFIALTQDKESSLLNGSNCLYIFANTLPLKKYLDGKRINVKMIDFISRKRLTPFLSVIKFEKDDSSNISGSATSFYKPRVETFIYQSFLDNGCPLFRSCNKRDVSISLIIRNPTATAPTSTANRAVPLSLLFPNSTPQSIEATLSSYSIRNRYAWFTHNDSPQSPSNLTFALTETSNPGAIAKALSAAFKSNKDLIAKSVGNYVVDPPTTLSEKKTLADTAFDEFKKYALLYQTARSLYDSGLTSNSPEKNNEYQLLKRRVNLQLQISKAAWSTASITQKLQELPELP